MTPPTAHGTVEQAPRLGRKRDHSRDPEILDAAIEILAEEGFDGMTIEMVAARAKAGKATLYRRWPSKNELVLEAISCLKSSDLDLDDLPDTGTLRGDLLALSKPHTIQDAQRKLKVMAGIAALLTRAPELTEAAHAALMAPRMAAHRILIERAVARGEARGDADIEGLVRLIPAMATFRLLVERTPMDREYLTSIIDGILLPAAGVAR